MGEFLSEQVEEWGLDDLGRAARVAPNPLRREAVNELIRRLSARRPARGDEAYIGGPPLPDDFDDDPLDTAPTDEPVSREGEEVVDVLKEAQVALEGCECPDPDGGTPHAQTEHARTRVNDLLSRLSDRPEEEGERDG